MTICCIRRLTVVDVVHAFDSLMDFQSIVVLFSEYRELGLLRDTRIKRPSRQGSEPISATKLQICYDAHSSKTKNVVEGWHRLSANIFLSKSWKFLLFE